MNSHDNVNLEKLRQQFRESLKNVEGLTRQSKSTMDHVQKNVGETMTNLARTARIDQMADGFANQLKGFASNLSEQGRRLVNGGGKRKGRRKTKKKQKRHSRTKSKTSKRSKPRRLSKTKTRKSRK